MVNEQPGMDQGQSGRPGASSIRLQILSTEHWSLLATRSLTYTESFSRVGMFLTVLTGAVVALALLAQVGQFNPPFTIAALLILSVVFFVGLATIGRLRALNRDDVRWVAGMNRLRHAYLEMDPDLEPYFITSGYDDMSGVLSTMALETVPGRRTFANAAHGLSTLPGVMGVVVSVVAGVLGSLVAVTAGAREEMTITVGAVVFLTTLIVLSALSQRGFLVFASTMQARFPSTQPTSRA
jgi:hypothetical protein